jgi:hypothetical protein
MDYREIRWGGVNCIYLDQNTDQSVGSREHGNELSVSIRCCKILEYLSDWHILKEGSAPWS